MSFQAQLYATKRLKIVTKAHGVISSSFNWLPVNQDLEIAGQVSRAVDPRPRTSDMPRSASMSMASIDIDQDNLKRGAHNARLILLVSFE